MACCDCLFRPGKEPISPFACLNKVAATREGANRRHDTRGPCGANTSPRRKTRRGFCFVSRWLSWRAACHRSRAAIAVFNSRSFDVTRTRISAKLRFVMSSHESAGANAGPTSQTKQAKQAKQEQE